MEDVLAMIGQQHECIDTQATITGQTFGQFFRPMVETTLAVGKINPKGLDPLIITSPKGMLCIAKTVRERGDGEGAVFFLSKTITSDKTSYICMDFNQQFLEFCRAVRKEDWVLIRFDREFYFLNLTRAKEEKAAQKILSNQSIYRNKANPIADIQREVTFALKLLATAPPQWTGKILVPAREIRKFYLNVWKYQHRALFYHVVQDKNVAVIAYSEDALRDMFDNSLARFGFETPKRRFFMARHFVSSEDGIWCSGEGKALFRANFRILSDIAKSGLDVEFDFGDLHTPYGITARNEDHCFRMICENAALSEEQLQDDLKKTLFGLVALNAGEIEKTIQKAPLLMEKE